MENLVPLGTGNSRLMKSNISPSTTLAQLIQMLNNGTFPYDIGPLNTPGISQQGTPLNKDTLLKDATAALYGYSDPGPIVPDHLFATLSKAVLYYSVATPKYQEVTVDLSTAQEGDIVKLEENGKLVDFYVAKLNYESELNGAGRTLVVHKDTYDDREWDNGNVNAYASSDLDSWFNSTYKNMLDADIRSLIGTTKIRYTPGNGNNTVGTLERAIFALSLTELGQSHTYANTEGSALPIASTLRIAYHNGSATTQWTRSPRTGSTSNAWRLRSDGSIGNVSCDYSNWARPAFTLPSSFSATYYVDSSGNLHDQQEYEAAGSTTDVKGNPITIGTQIATGSYVGTGTHGSGNPTILNFEFVPKIVMITKSDDGIFANYHTIFLWIGQSGTYGTSQYQCSATLVGNSLQLCSGAGALWQANENRSSYLYTAIG